MKDVRKAVRDAYGKIGAAVKTEGSCCSSEPATSYGGDAPKGVAASCCSSGSATTCTDETSRTLGYSEDELSSAPEGANLNLGVKRPRHPRPRFITRLSQVFPSAACILSMTSMGMGSLGSSGKGSMYLAR